MGIELSGDKKENPNMEGLEEVVSRARAFLDRDGGPEEVLDVLACADDSVSRKPVLEIVPDSDYKNTKFRLEEVSLSDQDWKLLLQGESVLLNTCDPAILEIIREASGLERQVVVNISQLAFNTEGAQSRSIHMIQPVVMGAENEVVDHKSILSKFPANEFLVRIHNHPGGGGIHIEDFMSFLKSGRAVEIIVTPQQAHVFVRTLKTQEILQNKNLLAPDKGDSSFPLDPNAKGMRDLNSHEEMMLGLDVMDFLLLTENAPKDFSRESSVAEAWGYDYYSIDLATGKMEKKSK